MDIPMLDEAEWTLLSPLLSDQIQAIKNYLAARNASLEEARKAVGAEALRAYKQMTGFEETNVDALYHHRLSLYGPPCPRCAKPFRTPKASFCAACGFRPNRILISET